MADCGYESCDCRTYCVKDAQKEEAFEAMRKNADRYLVLREMHWSNSPMAVVTEPRKAIKPGYVCPSKELLDEALDTIIKEKENARTKPAR